MPCDSIVLNKVELKLADKEILLTAIAKLEGVRDLAQRSDAISFSRNYQPFTIRNGKLECRAGLESVADEIKRAYSLEVVTRTAKKYGWTVNKTTKANKLQVTRRF